MRHSRESDVTSSSNLAQSASPSPRAESRHGTPYVCDDLGDRCQGQTGDAKDSLYLRPVDIEMRTSKCHAAAPLEVCSDLIVSLESTKEEYSMVSYRSVT